MLDKRICMRYISTEGQKCPSKVFYGLEGRGAERGASKYTPLSGKYYSASLFGVKTHDQRLRSCDADHVGDVLIHTTFCCCEHDALCGVSVLLI